MKDNEAAWGPYLLVLTGAAAGLAAIGLGRPAWEGGVIVGGALLVGSALRLLLSPGRAGSLAVRTRKTDVIVLATLGTALVAGSLSLLLPLHTT